MLRICARCGRELARDGFTAVALPAVSISITACAGPPGSGPYGRVTFLSGKVTKACSGLGPCGVPSLRRCSGGRALMLIESAIHGLRPDSAPASFPPAQRLHSACANVAFGGVCTIVEKSKSSKARKAKLLILILILIFLRTTHRRRRTRLGRRPNAGDAEPGSEAGRRLAPMAHGRHPQSTSGRGPVERRRSEGTRRAKPGAMALVTFPERKVTRP